MALYFAAARGDLARLRELLGAQDADTSFRFLADGDTPLLAAASNGHAECVEALLAAGASVRRQNAYGWTGLYCAIENGSAASVRALIAAESDVNFEIRSGHKPFSFALSRGRRALLKMLLRAGAAFETRDAMHRAASSLVLPMLMSTGTGTTERCRTRTGKPGRWCGPFERRAAGTGTRPRAPRPSSTSSPSAFRPRSPRSSSR